MYAHNSLQCLTAEMATVEAAVVAVTEEVAAAAEVRVEVEGATETTAAGMVTTAEDMEEAVIVVDMAAAAAAAVDMAEA